MIIDKLKYLIKNIVGSGMSVYWHELQQQSLNTQISQRQLFFYYQQLKKQKLLPNFQDTGFRMYSQNDEDGLLLYIYSQIGFTNKVCVDIAFSTPFGANVTNLICNWGFDGLLIECKDNKESIEFFGNHPDTKIFPPKIIKKWVTTQNVNQLLKENNIQGEIDLLSLDIDGVDYWIWKAINTIQPRVVLLEYMNIFDAKTALTVPYSNNFDRFKIHEDFYGASLHAFVKLGEKKGYRLIGCNKYGFNAFFLREDLGKNILPTIPAKECLKHPQAVNGHKTRLPKVKNLGWIKV